MNNREYSSTPIFVTCYRCRHPAIRIETEVVQRNIMRYKIYCDRCDAQWNQHITIPTDTQPPILSIEE